MEVDKNTMSRLMITALGLGIASAALAQGTPGMPGQQNQPQAGQPSQPAATAPSAVSAAPTAPRQGVKRDLSKALKQEEKAQADMKKANKAGLMHPIKDIRYREKADRHSDKAEKDLKKASRLKSSAQAQPSATGTH
jgi:hypothetical protein